MDTEDEVQRARGPLATWAKRFGLVLAIAFLAATVLNATWWGTEPRGYVKLIAHRGTMQQYNRAGAKEGECTATRIEAPVQDWLEDTTTGFIEAGRLGSQAVQVDVQRSADGQLVLFHDADLGCRTDGHGKVGDHTLAELKALDIGYGYSADGGKTFPFRGKFKGAMPTLAEGLQSLPTTSILYNLKSADPAAADLLAAALKSAGRDVVARGDGLQGTVDQVARFKAAFPKAWAYSDERAQACTSGYLKSGWLGIVPEACRDGMLFVPINYQWLFAGWPNLTQERLAKVGAKVMITGPYDAEDLPGGLDLPEQIGKIPSTFRGYVWVEDIWTVGPALRPDYNKRRPFEEEALAKALAARRAARD